MKTGVMSGVEYLMTPNEESCSDSSCGELHHTYTNHCNDSFKSIYSMRLNSQLCDISLKVGCEKIAAHKLILASSSAYFYAMFNDDMIEKNQREVELRDVDCSALQLLIDYAYTGEIRITEDNVQVLLPASSLLQMITVTEACCNFLIKQLQPSNCLGIRRFADAHACVELHKESNKYALQNFQEVMKTEEFLLLPFDEVKAFVSNKQLNVASEEDVFLGVMNWIKHDSSERVKYISQLLVHVKLPLLGRQFLMSSVVSEPLVRQTPECNELLLEAMKYHLLPEQRSSLNSERMQERQPEGLMPYVFAIGGGSLFAIHSECECYNPVKDTWFSVAPMLYRRSRAGVASLSRQLYVVGGYDGACDLATCECYNPSLNKWSPITSMGTKRSCLGVCVYDGLLYACGGYDGASCLSSMERYDPLTGVWSACPAMETKRRYCRLAVVENSIYALGGFDSTNYQASAERFDPRIGHWMSLPSMTSRRSSCGVASVDGMLYCIGGNDGTMCMSSGERFNPRRNAWEPIAAMLCRRSTHEVVEINGNLLVIGGNDGSASLSSVEKYEVSSNKWTLMSPMLTRRSSVGAAVVQCFHMEKRLSQLTQTAQKYSFGSQWQSVSLHSPRNKLFRTSISG